MRFFSASNNVVNNLEALFHKIPWDILGIVAKFFF